MAEIVGSEIEIGHIVETNYGITMKEIDLIVEIDHETTTKMTIEKKIIGRTKFGNIKLHIEIIMEICVMMGS